jgi:hypothetical protein
VSDAEEMQLLSGLRSAVATMEHLGKIALEAAMAFKDFIRAYEENELTEDEETDSE